MEAGVVSAVWGKDIAQDVFQRWNQGFIFSSKEPLALVQYSGGPCAVLAPVQAFIFQKHLYEDRDNDNLDNEDWRKCESSVAQGLLISVLSHILINASSDGTCRLALLDSKAPPTSTVAMDTIAQVTPTQTGGVSGGLKRKHPSPLSEEKTSGIKREPSLSLPPLITGSSIEKLLEKVKRKEEGSGHGQESGCGLTLEALSSALRSVRERQQEEEEEEEGEDQELRAIDNKMMSSDALGQTGLASRQTGLTGSGDISSATTKTRAEDFHSKIRVCHCTDLGSTVRCIRENLSDFFSSYGVLLFLYSVVLTKGIDRISEEREETEQPLIDPLHGHGSQNLINLLLTGRCVTNVFDLDKDLGGMKLLGIPRQSTVGFLTILESLHYCEVGSFLKNPIYPVWLIASETHLTVLFSLEIGLTSEEDAQSVAKREFSRFSIEGDSCLMATDKLTDLLQKLNLETDSGYVEYMKKKLDKESAGIILLSDFLNEFYPFPMECERPKAFTVYHYNGLIHNNEDEIQLARGQAVALGEAGGTSSDISLINCLQTKWPDLIIHWDGGTDPKII
ncbi:PREDICTED: ubiquitin carboxyl-terminal hydrolase FAM188A-like isoform X2 [Amphimedon queenslandica]|uniref:Ubiquitin carboxyl-terminal hydrolase MINDY n=1 Tax=Amphimedon queenslandica TaxID=400682 RepID=A0A1X7U6C3_AMPQE|nr:PREDICTED: ubiquitin carboxyl-terminal hydrolase FAM188A-like isoform X2 [Amphimedon queenslandica]|eukprot:XP_019856016.1 PREDICTED: ubiquitin carboxyl-terminal hydrolase FAM188A-like isoform X2 [Amphimedon queenslandica]